MLSTPEAPHLELSEAEEIVRGLAALILSGGPILDTVWNAANEICDRYFAPQVA